MRTCARVVVVTVPDWVTCAAADGRGVGDDAERGVGVDAIEIEERDANDRERAVVHRVLAVGDAVVGRERVAVEHALEADALPDADVARVRRAEEHRVPEQAAQRDRSTGWSRR